MALIGAVAGFFFLRHVTEDPQDVEVAVDAPLTVGRRRNNASRTQQVLRCEEVGIGTIAIWLGRSANLQLSRLSGQSRLQKRSLSPLAVSCTRKSCFRDGRIGPPAAQGPAAYFR